MVRTCIQISIGHDLSSNIHRIFLQIPAAWIQFVGTMRVTTQVSVILNHYPVYHIDNSLSQEGCQGLQCYTPSTSWSSALPEK